MYCPKHNVCMISYRRNGTSGHYCPECEKEDIAELRELFKADDRIKEKPTGFCFECGKPTKHSNSIVCGPECKKKRNAKIMKDAYKRRQAKKELEKEDGMLVSYCEICGKKLLYIRKKKRFCDDCGDARIRERSKKYRSIDYYEKTIKTKLNVCEMCGDKFMTGNVQQFCVSCKKERNRQKARDYYRKKVGNYVLP